MVLLSTTGERNLANFSNEKRLKDKKGTDPAEKRPLYLVTQPKNQNGDLTMAVTKSTYNRGLVAISAFAVPHESNLNDMPDIQ